MGSVAAGYERVRAAFELNFERHGEIGASCCVYVGGRLVADLAGGVTEPGGQPYTGDTLQMVMSTSKGITAIAAHLLAQEGLLDLDAPVTEYWPEFGAAGKGATRVRWLLSHRAGLPVISGSALGIEDIARWDPVVEALAAEPPAWKPDTAHGYHTTTYGWLAGEVIRRAAGMTAGRVVTQKLAEHLGVECYIGLPAELDARVAPQIPAPARPPGGPPDPFADRLADPSSLMHRSFFNPGGWMQAWNTPQLRGAEMPAVNCITNARALARIYAACIGAVDGVRLLKPEILAAAVAPQSDGHDLVLGYDTRYSTGFQLPFPVRPMAGEGSFGHYGMGGSVGFANRELGIGFGYVMNQMLSSSGVDPRPAALIDAVLASPA